MKNALPASVGLVALLPLLLLVLSPSLGHGPVWAASAPHLPEIDSYHIHVLFMETNNASVAEAMQMRAEFVEKFKPSGTCKGLFHQPALCMFETEYVPDAPFPTAYWAAYIPKEDFATTVPWAMQRRNPDGKSTLSLFVHPNTDLANELNDHTIWPMWGGPVWPLDLSIFHKD